MFRDFPCSRIALALLSVAVCSPIASLPALSQPQPVASLLTSQPDTSEKLLEATTAPVREKLSVCNHTHPVFCIYANRNWVSQLEQELWTTNSAIERPQDLDQQNLNPDTALESPPFRATDAVHLSRKIRFLTRLKTWLDAVS